MKQADFRNRRDKAMEKMKKVYDAYVVVTVCVLATVLLQFVGVALTIMLRVREKTA